MLLPPIPLQGACGFRHVLPRSPALMDCRYGMGPGSEWVWAKPSLDLRRGGFGRQRDLPARRGSRPHPEGRPGQTARRRVTAGPLARPQVEAVGQPENSFRPSSPPGPTSGTASAPVASG